MKRETRVIEVGLTEAEYEVVLAAAKVRDQSPRDYLRKAGLRKRKAKPAETKSVAEWIERFMPPHDESKPIFPDPLAVVREMADTQTRQLGEVIKLLEVILWTLQRSPTTPGSLNPTSPLPGTPTIDPLKAAWDGPPIVERNY